MLIWMFILSSTSELWSGTGVLGSDTFYFSVEPKSPVRTIDGHRLVLPCDVSDRNQITFHWTFNDQLLENTTRRYQNHSQLIIDPVYRQRDSGLYQCVARNHTSSYSVSSRIVELDIEWIGQTATIELISPLSADSLKLSDTLQLRCNIEGTHLHISWYRNSVRVSTDDRVQVETKTLTIRSLSVGDNGIYSCAVENGAGYTDSHTNFAVMLKRPDIANLRAPPKDLTVNKTSTAQFDCIFENVVRVDWFARDEGPLKNSTRRTIFPNGTLFLPKVKSGDEGSYKCVGVVKEGRNGGSSTQEYVAQLKIANLPTMTRNNLFPKPTRDGKYVVKAGSILEVFCRTKEGAQPSATVNWLSKDEQVSNGPLWLIEAVRTSQSGNYTCRAHTQFATESVTVFLLVTVLPLIIREPSDVKTNEGTSFQLVCSFKGSPAPLTSVSWYRSQPPSKLFYPIQNSPRYQIATHDASSILSVRNAQASEDTGLYRCQILTDGFEPVHSETANVFIRERLKFTSKPINQPLELHNVEKLHCRAQASDEVTIRWFKKGGGPKEIIPLPSHVRDAGNGTLIFDGVEDSDEGVYMCMATTSDDTINATLRIEVVVKPRFLVKPAGKVVAEGQEVVLDCSASGEPAPAVHWSKTKVVNGTEAKRWTVLENGSLRIENARQSDAGSYACTIGNKGGLEREEAVLTVQPEFQSSVTQTIVITVSCAVGYIFLVILLVIYCKRKRSRKTESPAEPLTVFNTTHKVVPPPSSTESQALLMQTPTRAPSIFGTPRNPRDRLDSSSLTNSHVTSPRHYDRSHTGSDDCRYSPNTSSAYSSAVNSSSNGGSFYSRNQLYHIKKVGRGNFGDVLISGMKESPFPVVMIKTLQTREEELRKELALEIEVFFKVNHVNVIKYVGLCQATRTQMDWAIFEHSDSGDLYHFVRQNADQLTPLLLTDFASQIAQGMLQISDQRFVHRDLATRNCIVHLSLGGQVIIKVSILSISRDGPFDRDYYLLHNRLVPLRWMPTEAAFEDEYSMKSDVWSFGIVYFELLTRCRKQPYSDHSDEEVMRLLETGTLELSALQEINDKKAAGLIRRCIEKNPKIRPTFDYLVSRWHLFSTVDEYPEEHE